MAENETTASTTPNKSSKTNLIVVIIIAVVVVLAVAGWALKFVAKKASTALLEGAIENASGVKTDLSDVEKGKVTYTDKKTGDTFSIGSEKLPDTFPKDFPLYPNAKVISSVTSSQGEKAVLLVIFETTDGLDKVVPFYKSGIGTGGWEITSSFDSDTLQTWAIAKENTEGSLSITSQEGKTTIQVMLGDKQ